MKIKLIRICKVTTVWVIAFLFGNMAYAQTADKNNLQMLDKIKASVVDIQIKGSFNPSSRWQPTFLETFVADYLEKPEIQRRVPVQYRGGAAGIVLDASGLILTNAHAVSYFDEIQVQTSDGKRFQAKLINKDVKNDLAVLKVQDVYAWQPIQMADPAAVRVGEPVYAIGNPFSYSHTVTQGIVSGVNRRVELDSENSFDDMIQTTADANPGNSGGPLVNQSGKMFGIITLADRRARGINFAISIQTIQRLLPKLKTPPEQLPEYDSFKKDFCFSVRELSANGQRKIVISEISINSKAYKSGLRINDELRKFNHIPVATLNELLAAAQNIKPSVVVHVEINRSNRALFTYVGGK